MRHEAAQAREAAGTGGVDSEGRIGREGGRATKARPPDRPRFRLKRSVELFPASDGAIYLLRLGTGDEHVLPEPTAADRLLLEMLNQGYQTPGALADATGEPERTTESLATLEQSGLIERESLAPLLSPAQAERYDRQQIYFADLAGVGEPAEALQQRLQRARVVLVGCGGLGSWAASGLALAGVGSLILIDDDRVELSNLNRQLLFRERDIGRPKVDVAAAALAEHNPELEVRTIRRRVRGPEDLQDALDGSPDLLIATADWPPHLLARWVNDACLAAAVPYITAGQFPPRLRIGPLVVPGVSACHECLERQARRDHPLYDELAAHRATRSTPDATLGAITGVIGCLLASEAIHHLTGAGPATQGRAIVLDLRTFALFQEEVRRDPLCSACRNPERPLKLQVDSS